MSVLLASLASLASVTAFGEHGERMRGLVEAVDLAGRPGQYVGALEHGDQAGRQFVRFGIGQAGDGEAPGDLVDPRADREGGRLLRPAVIGSGSRHGGGGYGTAPASG